MREMGKGRKYQMPKFQTNGSISHQQMESIRKHSRNFRKIEMCEAYFTLNPNFIPKEAVMSKGISSPS